MIGEREANGARDAELLRSLLLSSAYGFSINTNLEVFFTTFRLQFT